jgi:hypothetical protein
MIIEISSYNLGYYEKCDKQRELNKRMRKELKRNWKKVERVIGFHLGFNIDITILMEKIYRLYFLENKNRSRKQIKRNFKI